MRADAPGPSPQVPPYHMLRVFGVMALIDAYAVSLAFISQVTHNLSTGRTLTVDPVILLVSAFVGHLLNVLVVPCLLWKDLRIALPWTLGPPIAIAVAASYVASPLSSLHLALLALCVASIFVALLLPRTYDVLRAGMCESCGYDLRGNLTGTCPECGSSRLDALKT